MRQFVRRNIQVVAPLILLLLSGSLLAIMLLKGNVNVYSGLLLIIVPAVAVLVVLELMGKRGFLRHHTLVNLRLLWFTSFICIVLLELFLRFGLARWANYSEQNGNSEYISQFTPRTPSWYYTHRKNVQMKVVGPEFTHTCMTNSLGLCGELPTGKKSKDEFRFLGLGDSFTEGVGAPQDSGWISGLERHLKATLPGRQITGIRAGVGGSDPWYEYVLLRDKLLIFSPDIVVMMVNTSDVNDYVIRGGMKRFRPDSTVQYRKAPGWEKLYALSFIVRHAVHDICGYNWLLMKHDEYDRLIEEACDSTKSIVKRTAELCDAHEANFIAVFNPTEPELVDHAYYPRSFNGIIEELESSGIPVIDLIPYFRDSVGIPVNEISGYFWPINDHCNTRGYQLYADGIMRALEAYQFIPRSDTTMHRENSGI